jgi:hypothetical protein
MKFEIVEDLDPAGALKSRSFNEISKHFLENAYTKFKEMWKTMGVEDVSGWDQEKKKREIFYQAIQKTLDEKIWR